MTQTEAQKKQVEKVRDFIIDQIDKYLLSVEVDGRHHPEEYANVILSHLKTNTSGGTRQ